MKLQRLAAGDRELAREMFRALAETFEEDEHALDDAWIDQLLGRQDFWAIAACANGEVLGGLTAHTLPMTRAAVYEIFIYDIAVKPAHQRKGVGAALVAHLRERAAAMGITNVFVPADNEDAHALDFYRAIGGQAQAVTMFTFP